MSYSVVVAGVVIHLILLYSIFDIYYTSPVVTNVPAHEITKNSAPADRLVVISADGLRWDTFNKDPDLSPFLHGLIRNRKGVFGVSQSHVPTESRPGHVAMFAGFTEDVSAVARGWKKNPVPFDSVLNRSHEAYMWGSPDIVSLFDDRPHIHSFSYDENDEDFGSNEAYKLDEWVFDHVQEFLTSAKTDSQKMEGLSAPRKVFFLHLLGLDTNGHGNKPHSSEYKENLKVVDAGIARMVKLFEEVFPEGRTAWVFTADHGMTDWGSHGGGSDEEILTPFVAWGAGLAEGGPRRVISQVDLAPLMSSLVGVPIPVNSVGILPVQLLSSSPMYIFRAGYSNFLQLKEYITAVRNEKAQRLWFTEFDHFGDRALQALEAELLKLAKLGRYIPAATLFVENADFMRQAIFHYHRYDRSFLGMAVSAAFVGWISLVWCCLTAKTDLSRRELLPNAFFRLLLLLLFVFCLYCRLPWTNFIYVLLPVFLFSLVENVSSVSQQLKGLVTDVATNYKTMSFAFLVRPFVGFIALSLFLFICIIVFMDRRFLAFIFLLLSLAPNCYPSCSIVQEWSFWWRVCCFSLLPFPFCPNVGRFEIPFLCVLSPIILGFSLRKWSSKIAIPQVGLLSAACFIAGTLVFVSSYVFTQIPAFIRLVCWLTLPISFVAPLFASNTVSHRVVTYLVALYVPYSLLSIAYESLFMLIFLPLLLLFLRFEFCQLSETDFNRLSAATPAPITNPYGRVQASEYRRAVLCVAFVLSALFGTGNFASMNSFNPSTLARFISVFSPFTMASLLVAKLLIPLLMVTLVLCSVLRFDPFCIQRISYLVLIVTDLMAMCFFHQLKDDGSWLDIGLSISQYLVSMCMSVALLILLMISRRLMTATWGWEKLRQLLKSEQECLL